MDKKFHFVFKDGEARPYLCMLKGAGAPFPMVGRKSKSDLGTIAFNKDVKKRWENPCEICREAIWDYVVDAMNYEGLKMMEHLNFSNQIVFLCEKCFDELFVKSGVSWEDDIGIALTSAAFEIEQPGQVQVVC